MNAQDTPIDTLDSRPLPVQAKLAACWTSFMFLYIYVDYLALYKPGFIDDILVGVVHSTPAQPLSPLGSRSLPSRAS